MQQATLRDEFYIKINGKAASEAIMDAIKSVEVDDSLTLPSMFTIHFMDSNMDMLDGGMFDLGKEVEILAQNTTLIKGEITAIEPIFTAELNPTFLVRGYDKCHRLHRGKKTRVFTQKKDSDIAKTIAGEAGISCVVTPTKVVYEHLWQDGQTNWEFLISRAQRIGYSVFGKDGKLYFVKHPDSGGMGPEVEWGESLVEFNARRSAAFQVDKVIVNGWDPTNQKQISAQAVSAEPKYVPETGHKSGGGDAAKKAFGSAEQIIVEWPVSTADEAKAIAQGICNELSEGYIRAECVCLGNAKIKSGVEVKLKGLGEKFSGRYRVTHTLHRFNQKGIYKTEFIVGSRHFSTITELLSHRNGDCMGNPVIATVTNLEDPDDKGRIKVRIPYLANDMETGWARLAVPNAGPQRGIQWFPEVDDEVLVIFEGNDINRPLVIGGLWSQKHKPPLSKSEYLSNGVVTQRIIKSRSGHVIIMDDTDGAEKIIVRDKTEKNEIVIDTVANSMTIKAEKDINFEANGDFKVTAKGKITLNSAKDMSLESKGSGKIKASNINVDASGKNTVKGANLILEGTAKSELKAATVSVNGSAMTEIKGALVKIN
ncbi:VgrG-related protein [Chloroflexota bacterium]